MKFLLATYGSRGDVEPMLALADRLRERRHDVHLSLPDDAMSRATSSGYDCSSSGVDYRTCFGSGEGTYRIYPRVARQASRQFEMLKRMGQRWDGVVAGGLHVGAASMAQLIDAPYFYVIMSHRYVRRLGPWGLLDNFARLPTDITGALLALDLSRARAKAGMEPIWSPYHHVVTRGHLLVACDPPLVDDAGRYPGVVTGSWRRTRAAHPLGRRRGIYIGFGSMLHRDAAAIGRIISVVASSLDEPTIVLRGWSRLEVTIGAARLTDEADHEQVFSSVRVAVHHGGAGTVAAALRSGVPQVIVPHRGDQFHHAKQLARLGVASEPLPLSKLTPSRLIAAIQRALLPSVRIAAEQLAAQVADIDGTRTAADYLEHHVV